jgi:hypothetical protein
MLQKLQATLDLFFSLEKDSTDLEDGIVEDFDFC